MSKWQIDEWVDQSALKPIKFFSPTSIQRDLDLDINEIFERLIMLVKDGKLEISWRIVCPTCFRDLGIYNNTNLIPRFAECLECGKQEITKDMVFPLFSINYEYKNYIIAQKKTSKGMQVLVFARRRKMQRSHL
jgi:hypothetical protein